MKRAAKQKLVFSLALLFVINIALILVAETALAATYRQGSKGDAVKQIQQVLIRTGHLKGSADGIFGTKTTAAVKSFQKSCGLKVDGICGPQTLKYLGLGTLGSTSSGGGDSSSGSSSQTNTMTLLARIISAEARGEPYQGQVAVGAVIMNRIKHPSFPNTLSGVIYQPGAFTAIVDGQFNEPVAESSKKAAADAMNGWDPTNGCIYYYNPVTATNAWIRGRPIKLTIGKHVFCT